LKVVDLFSGCGGMSLGFQNAGYNIEVAFDNWKPAINVYRDNFSHPIIACDLSSPDAISDIREYKPDMIIGGPPCQDFSSAGHQDESLGRADLTHNFANIISDINPEYFVMENVDRIIKSEIYEDVKKIFIKAGYGLTTKILDASFCGVPQKRKRLFLIGHLFGEDDFLNSFLNKNMSDTRMSVHDYLGDSLGVEFYFRIPRSYNRRGVFSIYEPCVTIRGVDRPIPKGYKKHPGDLVEIGNKVRALTVKERSYIQTFPESFEFEGTKTDLNQMIGNAVPVKLAEFVGKTILEYHISYSDEQMVANESC
jgi:DNA (cytosine-5)-methyltransferase 1